jgi:8-amino-7-oxononanoate synthase
MVPAEVRVGDRQLTFSLWRLLLDAGVFTNPIIPPAARTGLLRTSYMAIHTEEILTEVLELFAWAGRQLGIIPQSSPDLAPMAIELG